MSAPQPPQSTRRTIYPRDHRRTEPLTPAEYSAAKEQEKLRQQWDPGYVTREQAETIPQQALEASPELRRRVQHSQPDWPENRLSARVALGPLPTAEGQTVESRSADAADFMESCGQCVSRGER